MAEGVLIAIFSMEIITPAGEEPPQTPWESVKKWFFKPKYIAVSVWLLTVAAGLILAALLMSGVLNGVIPSRQRRKDWGEVINQILNALFTIMALYEHPKFFHHFVLLLRWMPCDENVLRKVYSKEGVVKLHERSHMLVVVILLHITCFAQYVLCGLYWGFTGKTRPGWAEGLAIGVGTVAPVIAGLYAYFSLLRWEEEDGLQGEGGKDGDEQGRVIISIQEWNGGMFDCRKDGFDACFSFFCTFCVFGRNMERLGFGNKYVHIATFMALCIAPFCVFAISSLHVGNESIEKIMVVSGGALCLLGLLYGGFWRTRMRERFGLAGSKACCGFYAATDYARWVFCWACALAQEVRTARIIDGRREGGGEQRRGGRAATAALMREGVLARCARCRSCSAVGGEEAEGRKRCLHVEFGGGLSYPTNSVMVPPFLPLMRNEDEQPLKSMVA